MGLNQSDRYEGSSTAFADAFARAGIKGIDGTGQLVLDQSATEQSAPNAVGMERLKADALANSQSPEITDVSTAQLQQIRQALTDESVCPPLKV